MALVTFGASGVARASGLEIPEIGAMGLGRAGAVVARPADPMALTYNPAGIVALPGLQATLGSNFGSFSQCFQRYGSYANEDSTGIDLTGTRFAMSRYAASGTNTPYPRTCSNPSLALAPGLGVTYRIIPQLAIGIGAFPPHTVGREGIFPDQVDTVNGIAPSPARHLLFEKRLLLFYPSFTVAAAPVPWLRVGGTVQVGIASFEYATMLNPNDQSFFEQSPHGDIKLTLRAGGTFVAGNVGLQLLLPRFFTIGVKAQITPELNLSGPSQGEAVDGYYYQSACTTPGQMQCRSSSTFSIASLRAQPSSHVRAGVRFAMPRPGRPNAWDAAHAQARQGGTAAGRDIQGAYDPMRDDVFDLEVDFNYETTSTLGVTSVALDGTINAAGIMVTLRPQNAIVIRSDFQDTYGVRVGGDWNIIPDRFAMRMGFSYETGATKSGLSQIHLPTFESYSANLGAVVRFGWFTAGLSYGHMFFAPLNDPGGQREIITTQALTGGTLCNRMAMPTGNRDGACSVNAARYEASMDLVGLNLTGRW